MLKKLQLFILLILFTSTNCISQTTKVQFINNIADVSTPSVDIWINGVKSIPDIFFRTCTPYSNYATSVPLQIGIAPSGSTSINDTFFSKTLTISPTNEYVLILAGIKSSSGYSPMKPVNIYVYPNAKTIAAGGIDLLFANMATDALDYDFRSGIQTIANNISYGNFSSNYSSFSPIVTKIRTTNDLGNITYKTYEALLNDLSINNKACVILTSGFLNPASNSNGDRLGLWLASPDGGNLIELQETTHEAIARVQFIHNCADTTGDTVDVYAGSERAINDFVFRNSTPFVEFYGNTPITFGIAPKNSSSSTDASYTQTITFDSLGTHVVIANGIKSAAGYTPLTPFRLTKYNNAREVPANASNHDILFCNGSTDAQNLTVKDVAATTMFANIAFDNFGGYYSITAPGLMPLILSGLTPNTYGSFYANFPTQGEALTLIASGFADSTKNSKGPKLHLYYARPSGGALVRLPIFTSVNEINNESSLIIHPNPVIDILHIKTKTPIQNISIINSVGVRVKYIKTTANTIDVSNLPAGIYIAEGQTANEKITQRFIKQ